MHRYETQDRPTTTRAIVVITRTFQADHTADGRAEAGNAFEVSCTRGAWIMYIE